MVNHVQQTPLDHIKDTIISCLSSGRNEVRLSMLPNILREEMGVYKFDHKEYGFHKLIEMIQYMGYPLSIDFKKPLEPSVVLAYDDNPKKP